MEMLKMVDKSEHTMTIAHIAEVIQGNVVCGREDTNVIVHRAFASDLMSDVLTLNADNLLLITGLVNLQAIRTAEMADIKVIVFARGKKVTDEMIQLAREQQMVLIECACSVYRTAGRLYQAGLKAVY